MVVIMKEYSWRMVAIQYLVVPMVGNFIGVEEVEFDFLATEGSMVRTLTQLDYVGGRSV